MSSNPVRFDKVNDSGELIKISLCCGDIFINL